MEKSSILKDLSKTCQQIISVPEENFNNLKQLISLAKNNPVVILSITKIFCEIAPLYKINIINHNVKQNVENEKLNKSDKQLLDCYGAFIGKIVKSYNYTDFKCSNILLNKLSHFNYTEKLITHVLEGTRSKSKVINEMCFDTLKNLVVNDLEGDLVEKISKQMKFFGFNEKVLEIFFEVPFLEEFKKQSKFYEIKKKIQFEKKTAEEKLNYKKNIQNLSKKEKKDEKKRKIQESKHITEDGKQTYEQKNIVQQKIANNLSRIYLCVLKEKMKKLYLNCFIGLITHRDLIDEKFYEGINLLIRNEIFDTKNNPLIVIYGIRCYFDFNLHRNLDFSKELEIFNQTVEKIIFSEKFLVEKMNLENILVFFVEKFYLKSNLNTQKRKIYILISNLMKFCCFKHSEKIKELVYKLIEFYEIDFNNEEDFSSSGKPYFIQEMLKKFYYTN